MPETDPLILDAQKSIEESCLPEMPDDAGFQERMSLFAQLENIRRDLEDALERVTKRANGMKEYLLEEMVLHDIDNMSVRGLSVFSQQKIYVSKKSEANGVTKQMICDALKEIGREDMISSGYYPSSLTSLVKEMMSEDGDGIPENLKKLLNIIEEPILVTRKS